MTSGGVASLAVMIWRSKKRSTLNTRPPKKKTITRMPMINKRSLTTTILPINKPLNKIAKLMMTNSLRSKKVKLKGKNNLKMRSIMTRK